MEISGVYRGPGVGRTGLFGKRLRHGPEGIFLCRSDVGDLGDVPSVLIDYPRHGLQSFPARRSLLSFVRQRRDLLDFLEEPLTGPLLRRSSLAGSLAIALCLSHPGEPDHRIERGEKLGPGRRVGKVLRWGRLYGGPVNQPPARIIVSCPQGGPFRR